MLNHISLMGRLTKDPVIRYTQSNIPVASFTLAVDRDMQSDKKATDFIEIVAWNKTAEFVGKYFTKGQLVAVDGRLQIRPWTDRDGNKRTSAEVVANSVYFAEKKPSQSYGQLSQGESQEAGEFEELEEDEDDGDLPF